MHHVALGTRDVARLAAFYCELLDSSELRCQEDAQGELRSVWLDLSGTILMIERSEAPATVQREQLPGVGVGVFLLAFRASGVERQMLERRAEALGQPIESRSEHTSYLRDPDGNRIAFSEYEVSP